MMVQYFALKRQAPDCLLFYRMGDFFELFFDDAVAAAETLDIALTSRGEHDGAPVPMCGVPVHAAEGYLARLIKGGHRVAIAEQVETPAEAKARGGSKTLVARDIVRLVTAGTLTEDALLDARSSNWLVAIAEASGGCALAAADISTGTFEVGEVVASEIDAELARLGPSEVIVAEGSPFEAMIDPALLCARPTASFDSGKSEAALKTLFGVATLDGFGDFSRAERAAMGGLIAYLDHAGRGALPLLRPPVQRRRAAHMLIDAATRESLEIARSQSGSRAGSLLACVDRSVTGAGARLLAADLSAPLMDRAAIDDRLALVQWLHDDEGRRIALRDTLRSLPDIARALGRIAASRGSPRDLGAIRDGLGGARLLRERLALAADRPALLDALLPAFDGHGALVDTLTRALVPSPPTESQNGGFIAEGYDAALDALRATSGDARRAIAALEAGYRETTGIASLKIKHNAVLGYHVEVPAKHGDRLMVADSGFTHRQTLAGVVRFNAPALHEEAMKVAQAGGHALAAEQAHLEELLGEVAAAKDRITAAADALARLDVAAGHAVRAVEGGWTRPGFADTPCLEIEGGRHPVVEAALATRNERFVANDCGLSRENRLWLVSGPNMGGKSTFLRQNALIVLLAQAGSYVPATRARLGLVDRLFSRVGASDNLARGRSTFMVEMVETAAILTQATPNSFVVLDEVGRGTSTYDGLALAWAVVEAVHDDLACRCLFATHYHELTRLAERCDALSLHHVRAREWKGDLVLLHELADGPADRSYGLAVAKLAGVPPHVVARAKSVLAKLEAGREKTGGLAAGLDDLPLFAAALAEVEDEKPDALRSELAALDADALTPRDALELVYRLKQLASEADAS
ncbi:DNA mismatch repair protein MutS [Sphingorhabdus soli]|uniref:DNA mismatch repair protein MutS n=2 Tax=Flavisphingopyxis soli TaxID=2601267 RepID=A0A5C6UP29_9SPHN|nr:DNA mismatch repair protein MutS [Sphingorhabdus soli]